MQSLSPRWQRGSVCGDAAGRHSQVHTPSSLPSNDGQGFPAAPRLRAGKAWQVKLDEGCQIPVASIFFPPSSSCSQSFPASLLHPLQDEVAVCHLLLPWPPACSLQHLHRAEGVQSCRGFRLFVRGSGKAAGRQHSSLDVGPSSTWLLPAWRILFCHVSAGASPVL